MTNGINIRVSSETKKDLIALGKKDESYNMIIQRLLDFYREDN